MPIVNNNLNMIITALIAIHFKLDVDKKDYASLLDAIMQDVVVRYGVILDRETVASTIAPYYANWKSMNQDVYHLVLRSAREKDDKELVMKTKKSFLSYIIDNIK